MHGSNSWNRKFILSLILRRWKPCGFSYQLRVFQHHDSVHRLSPFFKLIKTNRTISMGDKNWNDQVNWSNLWSKKLCTGTDFESQNSSFKRFGMMEADPCMVMYKNSTLLHYLQEICSTSCSLTFLFGNRPYLSKINCM